MQCLWLAWKVLYDAQFVVRAALGWVDTNAVDFAALEMCPYLLKREMYLYLLKAWFSFLEAQFRSLQWIVPLI
jgi:hypothetical protein